MPKKELKPGQIFNKWTIIDKVSYTVRRGWLYLVECSCDNKTRKELLGYDVEFGRSMSCGCIGKSEEQRKRVSDWNLQLIADGKHRTAGKKLNDLTKKYPEKFGKDMPFAYVILNGIKSAASKRKLEFKLNQLEAFEKYCLGSCFYCGFTPNWPETHNGIDRVNNEKGYIDGNCVSSCAQCNRAKNDLTLEKFYLRINKIYNFIILINEEIWLEDDILIKETPHLGKSNFKVKNNTELTALAIKYPENYGITRSSYAQRIWARIRYNALATCLKKNIVFDLDPIKSYENYILGECNYCGLKPQFPNTRNGIDRIDSNYGYIEENCVSCCEFCNQAKLDYTLDEFKEWVVRIYIHLTTVGWNFEEES
jgi:5-methylcytosine-specific restriction endonuclease McrA